ncbi:MAG: BatD family protein [Desulfovibrionaceae bacterium]
MRRVVLAFLAACALLIACVGTAAAASVSASVNMDMVPAGQPVVLTITVHDGDGKPDLSVLRDFEVARSGKSTSMQIVNGKRSSSESYSYMLLPKREGELSIPAVAVDVDGKTLSTEPLTVTVSPAETGEAPRSGQSPGRDVLLSSDVSRHKIYLGEPVLYTVSFYTAARVANFRFQPPEFQGFTLKDLGQRSGRRRLGGELYEVHQFPWLLTALKPGNYTIDPTRVQCDVLEQASNSGRSGSPFDAFGDSFFGSQRLSPRSLATKPVQVEVSPLPAYTGDVPFSGLVGELQLAAKLSSDHIEQGGSATLNLTISGDGNVMDAAAPPLNPPAGLKVYMDAPEEDVKVGRSGYSGSKTFRYALVGLEPGVYDIGPIRLAWFDAAKSAYVTEQTPLMKLTVAASTQVASSDVAAGEAMRRQPAGPREVTAKYQDILPLKDSAAEVLQHRPAPSVWIFLAGLILPPLAYLCFAAGLRLARRDRDKARELARQARVRADEAAAMAKEEGREQELFAALRQALLDAVLSPTGSPSSSLTCEEVAETLKAVGREALCATATALLDELDAARFGGRKLDADARAELAGRVRALVKEMTA